MKLQTSYKLTQVLAVCLSILPACLILALILKYGVDVPHWDEWLYVKFFEKFSQGTLTLGDLFAQQNEFRQFFPNLIFVGLGWLTRWDKRYELLVSLALASLVSINIYRLEKLTIGGSPARRITIYVLANLLIFSPLQYQNWLLGMQIVYFMPIACVTTCLVITYSQLGPRVKLLLCMGLATISTFSSANGILCWLLVLPLLGWTTSPRQTNRKWLMLVWIAAFVASAALYFHGYHNPVGHPSLSESLIHPVKALSYFLVLLGKALEPGEAFSVLGLSRTLQKIIAGITGLLLVAFFVVSTFYLRREMKRDRRAAAWLMLGTYSLATAVLITVGRVGFGVEQAFSSRYTTFTLYLPIALLHLIPIVLDTEITAGKLAGVKRRLLILLAGVVVALQLVIYPYYIRHMLLFSQLLEQSKACLLLINVAADDHCLALKVYPDVEYLKHTANSLDGLGFLRPALIKSNRVQDIAIGVAQPSGSYGSIDSVTQTGADIYTAAGWAMLPGWDHPADAILLTYDREEGDSVIFAIANPDENGGLLARMWRSKPPSEYARWQKSFSISGLPRNPLIISAWAFDARTGKAAPLAGKHIIQKTSAMAVK
ncbi:MAG: hypothetical protein QOF62_1720 [Pyrinomonadaceae bacterium]|nr:hypothetical protein [Pyrinomonadaceae bacterium]